MRFAQVNPDRADPIHAPASLTATECNHLSCAVHGLVCMLQYGGAHLIRSDAATVLQSCTLYCKFGRHILFAHALGVPPAP